MQNLWVTTLSGMTTKLELDHREASGTGINVPKQMATLIQTFLDPTGPKRLDTTGPSVAYACQKCKGKI